MSSPSLRYPLKPPEVSDDMESFVYTIYFVTLRYHEHDMTNLSPNGVDPQATPPNKRLAGWVWNYFLEEDARASSQGTFYVGGEHKYTFNNQAKVPFQLADQSTMFSAVIRSLQAFLAQHTVSLDEHKLKQYMSSCVGVAPRPAQLLEVPGFTSEDFLFSTLHKPQKDPLADHAQLFTLLNNAIECAPEQWIRGDKIFDQFDNLPGVILVNDKNSPVGPKRKRTTTKDGEELVELARGRPARTARTTRPARPAQRSRPARGNKKQKK